MSCKLKVVVSLLRIIATLLSLRPFNNLGLVHNKLGDFEKAKEYHELALSITEKAWA